MEMVISHKDMPPEISERQYIDMSTGLTTRSLAYLSAALQNIERQYNASGLTGPIQRQPTTAPPRPTDNMAVLLEVLRANNEHRYDDALRELEKLGDPTPEEDAFVYQRYISARRVAQHGLQQAKQRVNQQRLKDLYQLIVLHLKSDDAETRKEGLNLFRDFYKHHPEYDIHNIASKLKSRQAMLPDQPVPPRKSVIVTPLANLDFRLIPAGSADVKLGQNSFTNDSAAVQIPAFYIARYPLTNEQAQPWYSDPNGFANPDWWSFSPFAQEWRLMNHKPTAVQAAPKGALLPFTNVSWYEAMALCRYLSSILGFTVQLPTRAQRIRAARGDTRQPFAWLGEFTPNHANALESRYNALTDVTLFDELGTSAFSGISDLCGNCWEWCRDDEQQGVDLTTARHRAIHGGSYKSPVERARIDFYYAISPSNLADSIGLRLVIED